VPQRDGDAGVGGHRDRRRDARDHLERDARGRQGGRFLTAAGEDERIAALEAHDRGARAAPRHEQGVDVVLGEADVTRRLPHVDALGPGRRQVEQGLLRQAVVDDDVGAPQHVERPHGE
jgi:hypothetical protein